jgi:hypothetical protein
MKRVYYGFKILTLLILGLTAGCDGGISPEPAPPVEPGFSGTVTFVGEWPSDITQTNIVLFKDPLLSDADFNVFNLRYISNSIPNGSTTFEFDSRSNFLIANIEPGEYAYLAVAQSKTPELSLQRKDWFVTGVYYAGGDTTQPGTLVIPEATFVSGISIICDFDNPPPQPPGGEGRVE